MNWFQNKRFSFLRHYLSINNKKKYILKINPSKKKKKRNFTDLYRLQALAAGKPGCLSSRKQTSPGQVTPVRSHLGLHTIAWEFTEDEKPARLCPLGQQAPSWPSYVHVSQHSSSLRSPLHLLRNARAVHGLARNRRESPSPASIYDLRD